MGAVRQAVKETEAASVKMRSVANNWKKRQADIWQIGNFYDDTRATNPFVFGGGLNVISRAEKRGVSGKKYFEEL